jgi:predicted NBD/HSP70 family sugar kinase
MIKVAKDIAFGYARANTLIKGAIGTAGELSHISVDSDGEHCTCGGRGCLESIADEKSRWSKIEEKILPSLIGKYGVESVILWTNEKEIGNNQYSRVKVEPVTPDVAMVLSGAGHVAAVKYMHMKIIS